MTTYVMLLSFTKPPLSMNDRMHWAKRAKITAEIKREVMLRARSMGLPKRVGRVSVLLNYQPRDNRRRDTDNLVATLKPAADALSEGTVKHPGYGLVVDDTPEFMAKPEPVIHRAMRGEEAKLWLEITVL